MVSRVVEDFLVVSVDFDEVLVLIFDCHVVEDTGPVTAVELELDVGLIASLELEVFDVGTKMSSSKAALLVSSVAPV